MTPKNKERIVCALLFAAGIALCGASFVMPPLAVLGAGLLAGGLTVLANILQDKDRITVNNNYTNYRVLEPKPEVEPAKPEVTSKTPSNRLKSFFGFKNKKFMKHHEELLKSETETPAVEEHESNSMQLPTDVIAELEKLNRMFKSVDMELISKVAREFEQKSHDHDSPDR